MMGWWFTTAAVVVCVQQCHSAPATPHARSTSSQNQPLVDGKCLTSLQNVCPFVFGPSCTTCAANPAVTAVCSAGNVSVYCGTDTGLVHSTSVAHLSTPRRDLSATSVGGMAGELPLSSCLFSHRTAVVPDGLGPEAPSSLSSTCLLVGWWGQSGCAYTTLA
jgi:hypothetical protein